MDLQQFLHRDPIADRGISVVIPVHNEAECLETVVTGVAGVLGRMGRGHEIIVVNDGSTDGTANVAEQLAVSNRRVRVLQHATREGYGMALRTGFQAAKYPLVLQMDGANRYQPSEIERLLAGIDQVDVVCGYRETSSFNREPTATASSFNREPTATASSFNREPTATATARDSGRLGYWCYRWLLRIVFAVHVRDVDCGFRLYRRSALRRIPIQSRGRFANAEIVAKANFMNMLVGEVGVSYRSRTTGIGKRPCESSAHVLREATRVFRRPQFCTTPGATDHSESAVHAA